MKFFFAGMFLLMSLLAQSQVIKQYDLIPYRKNKLWGFADTAKNIVIPPAYDEVSFFKEEITAVRQNNKWGFIDKKGKAVTPFKYDLAGDFSEGMCQVKVNNKAGYINNRGKEIIAPEYQFNAPFSEGVAVVSDSAGDNLVSKVIDKNGKIILSNLTTLSDRFRSGFLPVQQDEKNYFIGKNGKKLLLPPNADLYFEFADSLAFIKILDVKKDSAAYLGIINNTGQLVTSEVKDVFGFRVTVTAKQKIVANFTNGFAILQRGTVSYADRSSEYAFIDKTGKISMWYSSVRLFSPEGISVVVPSGDSTIRFIDTKFKLLPASVIVSDAGTFSEGMLRGKFSTINKWGYVDEQGQILIYPEFDECTDFSGGVASVTVNGQTGFIDRSGKRFWDQ